VRPTSFALAPPPRSPPSPQLLPPLVVYHPQEICASLLRIHIFHLYCCYFFSSFLFSLNSQLRVRHHQYFENAKVSSWVSSYNRPNLSPIQVHLYTCRTGVSWPVGCTSIWDIGNPTDFPIPTNPNPIFGVNGYLAFASSGRGSTYIRALYLEQTSIRYTYQ